MCGDYFNLNSKRVEDLAETVVSAYHIHIYFKKGEESEKTALKTAQNISERFGDHVSDIHAVGRVGPHTELNIGITITPESFGEILRFLQMNNAGLSILVHPRTGDELLDHGDAALWLGKPLPFNERFLDLFRTKQPKGPALR